MFSLCWFVRLIVHLQVVLFVCACVDWMGCSRDLSAALVFAQSADEDNESSDKDSLFSGERPTKSRRCIIAAMFNRLTTA